MCRQRIILTLLLAAGIVLPAFGAAPVDVELVEVKKIWDEAPHNAFTDLARFNDRARRFAVDARFIKDGGKCRLVIHYDNGEREPFRGFNRAA